MTKQTAKRGQNPKFSPREQALVDEANAKAEARGAITQPRAEKAQTARPTKGGKPVTMVAPAPAHNATEKAPHTKRALQQNAEAAKVAKAEQRVADAKAEMERLRKIAQKTGSAKSVTPERVAAFTAVAHAEQAFVDARKALQKLNREQETPEQKAERAAKAAPKADKAPRAPRVAVNRTIKPGAVKYENAKGGWTLYMVTLTLKHKDTDSATAAHKAGAAKAGQRADKPLDFKWMDAKGYIKLG